jgi:hypothetical protein
MSSFLTEDEARAYCQSQKLPQEFYWEVDARDYQETTIGTQEVLAH